MNIEKYVLDLSEISEVGALVDYFVEQSKAFGAETLGGYPLAYGQSPDRRNLKAYLSTFPENVRKVYNEYVANDDPFMEAALVKGSPVQYSIIKDQLSWNQAQLDFFSLLEDMDIRDGVGTPVCPKPGVVAYFVMTFRHVRPQMSWAELRLIHVYFNEFFARYWELSKHTRPAISMRERQILIGIMKGKSKSEISETLGLSANTVDTYTRRCFEKLQVKNRTEAAVKAFGLGLAYLDTGEG